MTMTGSCLCGAVTYAIAGEPSFVGNCYCADCRKESGTGHLTLVAVPAATVTAIGATQSYTKPGDSGMDVTRIFCPNCGTTLFGEPAMMAGMLMVRAGSLNEAARLVPHMAVYAADALPWDQPPAGMLAFAKLPPPG